MQIKGADAYVTDKEYLQRIQNRGTGAESPG